MSRMPREPDLWVRNKSDRGGAAACDELAVSAKTGAGLDELERRVLERLGLVNLHRPQRWVFCDRLRELVAQGDRAGLARYVAMDGASQGMAIPGL